MNKPLIMLNTALIMIICVSCYKHHEPNQIRLNDIQIIGSHNSYKRQLNAKIYHFFAKRDATLAASINYSHPDLRQQLRIGLRHFEIDVLKDPSGGRFAHPTAEKLTQQMVLTPEERTLLQEPGFKVMHIPDLDFSSHCILFQTCLDALAAFSKEQPAHLPIIVLIDLKESSSKFIHGAEVLTYNTEDYAELDRVLFRTFGQKLITPEEIIGQHRTLEQAVLNKGWPLLSESRGRFLFILDVQPHQLHTYRNGHASLQGRAMFGSYAAGEPEAAVMIRNNPTKYGAQIKRLVDKGYLVRTRADGGTGSKLKSADVKLRTEHAIASGAQIISTDFYPGAPQVLPSDFAVSFEQGMLYRCNQRVGKSACDFGG